MRISLIVAMSENRVIGRDGGLPWRLSADLRRFKRLTMGHHIIMGRKTFQSIGRLLPGRTSIVLTRQADFRADGAMVTHDIEQAKASAAGDDEVFVIGGGEIYREALSSVDRIYMTLVHANIDGDTFFPDLRTDEWQMAEQTRHAADEKNEYEHSFVVYNRVSA